MAFDLRTLFFLTMYVEAILGLLLLLAWVQDLGTRALAWWGAANLLRSLSIAIYGMYGEVPNILSIDLAGALLFTSCGVTWAGARVFGGRSVHPLWILSGALTWIALCRMPGFANDGDLRGLLGALIVTGFSWASAYELWRGRTDGLVSRWPVTVLLVAQGALFLWRTPLAAVIPQDASQPALASAWLTVLSPEAVLFTIAIAFVLLAIGKERAELGQKTLATTDALTGLFNRRGFMQEAEKAARGHPQRPIAVLLADLDLFKSINDRFGHDMGDRVLRVFATVCSRNLRSNDPVGRTGGEEFAVLVSDASRDNAFLVAERLRRAFEADAATVDGIALGATISVGVAVRQNAEQAIPSLLKQADDALYRAKARGRNRVELAPLEEAAALDRSAPIRPQPSGANLH
jgi:diguanylate cyclase (GGDEF)-like protein